MPKFSRHLLIMLQKIFETDEAIGGRLHISRQAVYRMRKAYGIPSVITHNTKRNKKMIVLFRKNMPVVEIAAKFNISISSVYRIIQDACSEGEDCAFGHTAEHPEQHAVAGNQPFYLPRKA